MDAGGRATQEQLPRGKGEGRFKQGKMHYFDPLILTFSRREKGQVSCGINTINLNICQLLVYIKVYA
jgi:hypothetical protein